MGSRLSLEINKPKSLKVAKEDQRSIGSMVDRLDRSIGSMGNRSNSERLRGFCDGCTDGQLQF